MIPTVGRVGAAVLVVLALSGACGSSASSSSGSSAPPTSPPAAPPPSTVLDGTAPVTPPFTADRGALVVTDGPAPDGVTEAQAVAAFHGVVQDYPGHPTTWQVFPGRVTLQPGLGAPPLDGVAAWVIVYQQYVVASCPMQTGDDETTAPPWGSHLTALLVTGPSISDGGVTRYEGAGFRLCSVLTEPQALSGPVLNLPTFTTS